MDLGLFIIKYEYLLAVSIAFVISFSLTVLIKKIALYFDIVDYAQKAPFRKIHKSPVPLMGGMAVIISFVVVLWMFYFISDIFTISHKVTIVHLIGISLASFIILFGGFLDDVYDLLWYKQLVFPLIAVLIIIVSGIGINFITNPFGGVFALDVFEYDLFKFNGNVFKIFLLSDIFTLIWLTGLMQTTKLLDGLDGLATGIACIAGVVLFILSINIKEPQVALLAAVFIGSCLGFLIFNFHPAQIFLGESGALFTGYMIGILGILSVGKVATAFLVMGIPIMDMAWVILRRSLWEKKMPLSSSDKKHFHHRLLDIGFSHKGAVIFIYCLAATFGFLALFLQSMGKFYALLTLFALMILLALFLVWHNKKIQKLSKFIIVILILFQFIWFLGCSTQNQAYDKGKVLIKDNVRLNVLIPLQRKYYIKGLAGFEQNDLKDNEGMLFVYQDYVKPTFWMKGMVMPIDIIWIRDNEIVGIEQNVAVPKNNNNINMLRKYYPPQPINYVVEVKAEFAKNNQIKVGDKIEIEF
jgi:UDP-GlcNAc:undecaprenyl-phosphate GlcNAc-1-phosphate transferase